MDKSYDIAVIGGGAAGLAAAIAAKRQRGDLSVAVIEREDRVGKKLLRTGNGRCNITNKYVCEDRYHGADPEFVEAAFDRFPVATTERFFASIGVMMEYVADGRAYPTSHQASSVVDALRFAANDLAVDTVCDFEVQSIRPKGEGFVIEGKERLFAKRVIVAVGSSAGLRRAATPLLEKMGYKSVDIKPAIVAIKTDPFFVRQLKGIKFDGEISAVKDSVRLATSAGEILFAEDGVSGPPALNIARLISHKKADQVSLDIFPAFSFEELVKLLKSRRVLLGSRNMDEFFTGMVNKRLGQIIVKYSGLSLSDRAADLSDDKLVVLAWALKDFRIKATGTQPLAAAQVAAGGIATSEFSPFTMESRRHKGLYAVGEVLDIDGDCGGFNLQWAWSSGLLAAESACASFE